MSEIKLKLKKVKADHAPTGNVVRLDNQVKKFVILGAYVKSGRNTPKEEQVDPKGTIKKVMLNQKEALKLVTKK